MIRAQGGNHFLFGFTKENITRLMDGEPIVLNLAEHGLKGPPISIVICYGETEESLLLALGDTIGPTTRVVDNRPGRKK